MTLTLRQKEIATGLFGIVFFFGGFLAAELALRTAQYVRFGGQETVAASKTPGKANGVRKNRQEGFYTEPDSGLRLPYPNQKLGQVRINNHGFRGPDLPAVKAPDTFRLAFLGSSTTYDADVAEGRNWPEQVARQLAERVSGCRIDFVNAGLLGFSTEHMERYWRGSVRRFDVDAVIILPGDMTADIQEAAKQTNHNTGQHVRKSWLARYSLLWEKIEKNAAVIKAQRLAYREDEKFQPDFDALTTDFGQKLSSLIDTTRGDGVFTAVATISSRVRGELPRDKQLEAAGSALFYMPYISIPTLIRGQDKYNETIRKTVDGSGAHLIEIGDSIPADGEHFVDSRHFNTAGSARMATRVVDELLKSPHFRETLKNHSAGCRIHERPIRNEHSRMRGPHTQDQRRASVRDHLARA